MKYTIFIALLGFLVTAQATPSALPEPCSSAKHNSLLDGVYPDYTLSPLQSLQSFEIVFIGEVVVPIRKCSLGFCAGIAPKNIMKGQLDRNIILQIPNPFSRACPPNLFVHKGKQWMIFAHSGTSKTGLNYYQTFEDGPSFPIQGIPNISELETKYHAYRVQLDKQIKSTLDYLR